MFIIFIPVATSSKDEHQAPSLREKYIQDIEDFKAKLSKANLITGKIAKLKSSDFYLSTQKINKMKQKLLGAQQINNQIDLLQKDSSYLNEEGLSELTKSITEAEDTLKILNEPEDTEDYLSDLILVQDRASRQLECVVCLQVPSKTVQVFSCSVHHLLCTKCMNNPAIFLCPICQQDFRKNPPTRNRLAEKMIQALQ